MKKLSFENLDDLRSGCAILSSGGGGNTDLPCMMAKVQMEKSGPVSLISDSELKPDDVVMPIGFIGAPSAWIEKVASGREFESMFECVEKSLNKKVSVVMPYEIGGVNGICPMIAAARFGMPVLDADMMGRSFPEAQMTSYNIYGNAHLLPGFISDCRGNTTVIYAANVTTLEKIGRQVCLAMGSIAAFGFFPLEAKHVRQCTIKKSVSKALSLGRAVRDARTIGEEPSNAVLDLCDGIMIGSGKITDIDLTDEEGFFHGTVTIQNKSDAIELEFKNEFLIAKCNGKILATTPDILTLLEQKTGTVIGTHNLEFGLKVHVIVLPAPSIWTSSEGLRLVGPRNFRYEIDYHPFIHRKKANIKFSDVFLMKRQKIMP
jgi:uncharacterized protein